MTLARQPEIRTSGRTWRQSQCTFREITDFQKFMSSVPIPVFSLKHVHFLFSNSLPSITGSLLIVFILLNLSQAVQFVFSKVLDCPFKNSLLLLWMGVFLKLLSPFSNSWSQSREKDDNMSCFNTKCLLYFTSSYLYPTEMETVIYF